MRSCPNSRALLAGAAFFVVESFFGIAIAGPGLDTQGRSEASYAPITNQPSRDQLFEAHVIPDGIAESNTEQVTSLGLPEHFEFPRSVDYDVIEQRPRVGAIFGIDISHHNGRAFPFDKLKDQEARFIYIKATQGTTFADPTFKYNWPNASAAGIRRGAYHFLSSSTPGKEQADAFVDYLNLHGGLKSDDLPPAIDLEWDVSSTNPDNWNGRGEHYIIKSLLDCLQQIEARTGRRPIIYTAKSWWGISTLPLSDVAKIQGYSIWIADYNRNRKLSERPQLLPHASNVIWQFTAAAALTENSNKPVDASIFYGDADAFRRTFGVPLN